MLIDSHCHIPSNRYELDVEEILSEAEQNGVEKLIAVGTSIKENKLTLTVSQKHKQIYPAIAIYPHENLDKNITEIQKYLEKTLEENKNIIAIGETGIDITNWKKGRNLKDQIKLFDLHVQLALENKLPVIIHNRNGDDAVIKILKKYTKKGLRGVAHCFTQNWDFAQKVLDYGFYISFSAMITYPKNQNLRDVVKKVPLENLLVETDAPYLTPQQHRGEINYPKYVKIVAQKVAEIKNLPLEVVEKQTYNNTAKLFGI